MNKIELDQPKTMNSTPSTIPDARMANRPCNACGRTYENEVARANEDWCGTCASGRIDVKTSKQSTTITPPFATPEEAINACNAESERAWTHYITTQKLDVSKAPQAAEAAKRIFLVGYFAGARWVSDTIVNRIMSKQPQ